MYYSKGYASPEIEKKFKALGLCYYHELDSDEAKANARQAILLDDKQYIDKLIKEARQAIKANINQCVNNRSKFNYIKNRLKHFKRIQNDAKALVSYIDSNLAMFYKDGSYHKFFKES